MSESNIQAEARTEFGKGAARRIRRDNKIPAVIYGHGNDPIHVILPGHQTMMALKHGGANALLALDIARIVAALTKELEEMDRGLKAPSKKVKAFEDELHTTVASPVPVANWLHIEDGKITSLQVAFDARELALEVVVRVHALHAQPLLRR